MYTHCMGGVGISLMFGNLYYGLQASKVTTFISPQYPILTISASNISLSSLYIFARAYCTNSTLSLHSLTVERHFL